MKHDKDVYHIKHTGGELFVVAGRGEQMFQHIFQNKASPHWTPFKQTTVSYKSHNESLTT